jgi:hypothetical protein
MMKCIRWLALFILAAGVSAKDVKVVELTNFRNRFFAEQFISLSKDLDVKVGANGVSNKWEDEMVAYGWILESETRRVVWELSAKNSTEQKERYNRKAEKTLRLARGNYEVYYAVASRGSWNADYRGIGDFLDDLFNGFRGSAFRREAGSLGITLSVDEQDRNAVTEGRIRNDEKAAVQLISLGDDAFEKAAFTLKEDARFRIYAIGEGDGGEMFDYGWIVNGKTLETVWEMDYRDTDHAGGADKNRIIDEEIVLPKGSYVVYFVTDGSHSYEDWNMLPPYDPRYWGITLWGIEQGFQKENLIESYSPDREGFRIVDITRIGNNRFEVEKFTLKEPAEVRIRCLGEYGYDDYFVDYGWILDAKTRQKVWEMHYRDTRYAGGGKKNRLFDGIVELKAGNYEVYYKTDDSHAYRRWNVGPPYDPESWGITIWGSGDDFNPEWVTSYRKEDDPDFLAQIIRVGDNQKLHRSFRLDERCKIRIYALGEGDDEMYDYGTIEDEDGHRIWRMEYRDTEHAGGAAKNRMINEVIRLDAGQYTVYYRSDGSHSFNHWNSDPPVDAEYWGITIRKEKE